MKALVGVFNQEKALVGAFSMIVQPVVESMDRFAALIMMLSDVLLNGKAVLELSTICHASKARDRAKAVVFKLKNELPRQQFSIAIQVSMDTVNIT